MSADPFMGTITGAVESARYKSQVMARDYKLSMAISKNTILGLAAGFLLALVIAIPFIAYLALTGVI